MSDGENMFAFQICGVTHVDQTICHCEFLGCITEDVEDEDNVAPEITDNKRSEYRWRRAGLFFLHVIYSSYPSTGLNDSDMDDAVCAIGAKRIKVS